MRLIYLQNMHVRGMRVGWKISQPTSLLRSSPPRPGPDDREKTIFLSPLFRSRDQKPWLGGWSAHTAWESRPLFGAYGLDVSQGSLLRQSGLAPISANKNTFAGLHIRSPSLGWGLYCWAIRNYVVLKPLLSLTCM